MTGAPPAPEIIPTLETGVDALRQVDPDTGQARLLLNPHQTFQSMLAHARRLLPGVHRDVLSRLIREAIPDAVNMHDGPEAADRRAARAPAPPRSAAAALPPAARQVSKGLLIAAAAVGLTLFATGWLTNSAVDIGHDRLRGAPVVNETNDRLLAATSTTCRQRDAVTLDCEHTAASGDVYPQTETVLTGPGVAAYFTVVDGSSDARIVYTEPNPILKHRQARGFLSRGRTVVAGKDWLYASEKPQHAQYLMGLLDKAGVPYRQIHQVNPDTVPALDTP